MALAPLSLATVSLDDKYALERGRVFLTGTQALVRLPMVQRRRDEAVKLLASCSACIPGLLSAWPVPSLWLRGGTLARMML